MNIVITGASYGLGRALAIAFSRQGARLALFARNEHNLSVTKSLLNNSSKHFFCPLNLSSRENFISASQSLQTHFSHVDCLINNASGWQTGLLQDMEDAAIEEQISSTVTGTLIFTKYGV
jgi:short-subunit dehydrogenase